MIYKGRDELEEELLHILDDDIFCLINIVKSGLMKS